MSKNKKRVNPNKIPATPQKSAEEADRAYYCAIANMMDSIAETGKYAIDEIKLIWDSINATAECLSKRLLKPEAVLDTIARHGIELGHISEIIKHPSTMAEAKRNAKSAYKLACAIMLCTLIAEKSFSDYELSELWARAQYKKDSIDRKYTTLRDVCDALMDDYGIAVAVGVKL